MICLPVHFFALQKSEHCAFSFLYRCKSMQSSNQTPSSFKRYCQIQRKKTPMDSLRMISGSRNTVRPHTASPVLQHALEHYSSESKHLVTSRMY